MDFELIQGVCESVLRGNEFLNHVHRLVVMLLIYTNSDPSNASKHQTALLLRLNPAWIRTKPCYGTKTNTIWIWISKVQTQRNEEEQSKCDCDDDEEAVHWIERITPLGRSALVPHLSVCASLSRQRPLKSIRRVRKYCKVVHTASNTCCGYLKFNYLMDDYVLPPFGALGVVVIADGFFFSFLIFIHICWHARRPFNDRTHRNGMQTANSKMAKIQMRKGKIETGMMLWCSARWGWWITVCVQLVSHDVMKKPGAETKNRMQNMKCVLNQMNLCRSVSLSLAHTHTHSVALHCSRK